ncbi:uncharacterized protein B0H18DRAFT_1042561, partial [Fomitopsis serialis]|uniref:uncharacterized protein n=1 Tax=Fomitopsis serialis TaxID=139415 RepID=UPI00200865A6
MRSSVRMGVVWVDWGVVVHKYVRRQCFTARPRTNPVPPTAQARTLSRRTWMSDSEERRSYIRVRATGGNYVTVHIWNPLRLFLSPGESVHHEPEVTVRCQLCHFLHRKTRHSARHGLDRPVFYTSIMGSVLYRRYGSLRRYGEAMAPRCERMRVARHMVGALYGILACGHMYATCVSRFQQAYYYAATSPSACHGVSTAGQSEAGLVNAYSKYTTGVHRTVSGIRERTLRAVALTQVPGARLVQLKATTGRSPRTSRSRLRRFTNDPFTFGFATYHSQYHEAKQECLIEHTPLPHHLIAHLVKWKNCSL